MANIEIENRYGKLYVKVPALVAHNNSETWSTSYSTETVRVPLESIIGILQLVGVKINLDDDFYKKVGNL
jgi:hypothetical protein